jgi:hypothetical protein
MEDDIYLCGWAQSENGFELWLKSRPRVRARGRTYLEAEDALLQTIAEVLSVYHAVLEFVPPLPKSEFDKRYSTPELYVVRGDAGFGADEPRRIPFETKDECAQRVAWYDDFFVAPICRQCGTPGGRRSERPLKLRSVDGRYDGGHVIFAGAFLDVFSETFFMLLTASERQNVQLRLVERERRARKQFFELLGPSGPPLVAVASRQPSGWHCETCGARYFPYFWSDDASIRCFVARADLPQPVPDVFTIGTQPNVSLCMSAGRWSSLVGKRGTRGLISQLVGVVPDEEVIREPSLKPR